MFNQSLKAFREWFAKRQDRKFMDAEGSAELMGGGVSQPSFLTALGAPKETRSLMARMAQRYGLRSDVLAQDSERALMMAAACSRCKHRTLCKHWLDGGAKSVDADRFCANAERFVGMKLQAGASPNPRAPVGTPKGIGMRLH